MKFKAARYILYGLLFGYFAFSDKNFNWLYNGGALLLALASFALAVVTYRKNSSKE